MTKKYKIHELAKDFNIQSKYIIEKLTERFEGDKKSQTALEDKELDYIFDLITKENSVESFDEYFTAVPKEKPKEEKTAKEPKKAEKKPDAKEPAKKSAKAPAEPAKAAPEQKKAEKSDKPLQARTKGEMRRIDTRSSSYDADKYNEKYENIAPANAHNQDNMVILPVRGKNFVKRQWLEKTASRPLDKRQADLLRQIYKGRQTDPEWLELRCTRQKCIYKHKFQIIYQIL